MKRLLICATLCASLAACATHSGVIPAGSGTYEVVEEAATGFAGVADLKTRTMRQAEAFCAGQQQNFEVIFETEAKPPFIFGNYPRAELHFRCISR